MTDKISNKMIVVASIGIIFSAFFLIIAVMLDSLSGYTLLNSKDSVYIAVPLLLFAVVLVIAILCSEYEKWRGDDGNEN